MKNISQLLSPFSPSISQKKKDLVAPIEIFIKKTSPFTMMIFPKTGKS
jgi:hypothetical protein